MILSDMSIYRIRPARFIVLLSILFIPSLQAADCVILLHGLGRTASSMSDLEENLVQGGYRVWNQGYPSTESNIESLAAQAIQPGVDFCGDQSDPHFVTHSLGGILVRQYLQDKPYRGRIVMISPPNHGSEIPDVLREVKLFRSILGPAALQLGTDSASVPNTLVPIQGQIGVITGNRSYDPWFSWLIPGPDDGKVSVDSARLEEMSDFLIVSSGHTFVMQNDLVIAKVIFFLNNGAFE